MYLGYIFLYIYGFPLRVEMPESSNWWSKHVACHPGRCLLFPSLGWHPLGCRFLCPPPSFWFWVPWFVLGRPQRQFLIFPLFQGKLVTFVEWLCLDMHSGFICICIYVWCIMVPPVGGWYAQYVGPYERPCTIVGHMCEWDRQRRTSCSYASPPKPPRKLGNNPPNQKNKNKNIYTHIHL